MRQLFSLLAVTALAVSFSAQAAPRAAKLTGPDADIRAAKESTSSLFNHPEATIQTSDVGGHIATVVTKQAFSDMTGYGEKAQVQVEVTDPFRYYAHGKDQDPTAILANVSSQKVLSGHDMGGSTGIGSNVTLVKVAPGTYRGTTTIAASLQQGDDMGVALGDVRVAFAGQKGWNSRYGQGYETPVTK